MKKLFGLFLVFVLILISACSDTVIPGENQDHELSTVEAAELLFQRVLPDTRASDFVIRKMKAPQGKDIFEIESKWKKIVIRGNNVVSIASGLNWYLKHMCNSQVSMNYSQISLPKKLPLLRKKIRIETPFEYRYFFNYCTYGYSMPWWNWEKWEQMIDYMAVMGVNMPLATIGQEAVWSQVYQELGMTDEQLDAFFVGPAHLPWGRMGNIDGLGGPLPKTWISKRSELQKKILARMRSMGMKPILQGFTGHVPKELTHIFPEADIIQLDDWAGIPGTMFLNPTDPLFARIGKRFIDVQTEMYGTDHLYDADCFIEVDPPSNDPEFLSELSQAVYESMAASDPEAIWILQGWFFFFRSEFWQPEQGRAFVTGIPRDKSIILDLYGEKNTTWDKTEAFYGQPWIWNVLCNQDQKVNMSGDLKQMQYNFKLAYRSEFSTQLKGIGTIPEGIGYNPVVQDLIYGKAWDQRMININLWIGDYAMRRYGTNDKRVVEAWQMLYKSVYARTRTDWGPLITTPRLQIFKNVKEDLSHIRKDIRITEENPFGQDYNVYALYEASKLLLECADDLNEVETYLFDLTNVHRELIYGLSFVVINDLTQAYLSGDRAALEAAGKQLIGLLNDLELITGTNENFLLGKWLKEARAWGSTGEEKDYYEWNARTIVSIWQPWKEGSLRDYASKQWNGMFSDYYKPRWELLISYLDRTLENGTKFDSKAFDTAVREIDFEWTLSNKEYPSTATGDPIEVSREIQEKYRSYFEHKGGS